MSARFHDSELLAEDGLRLHQRDWVASRPRARLLLAHGLGEHGGRYARLAEELADAGISVRCHDHRGHGRSDGVRARVDGKPDQLAHDLIHVFDRYAAEAEDPPFLLGHSMGGLVAMYATLVLGLKPRGLIASSPALRTHANGLQRTLARLLAGSWPHVRLRSGLPPDRLSHDPHVADEYRNDPLNHDRISARLAQFLITGGPRVLAAANASRLPTLLQFAADDRFVDPEGARAFAGAMPQHRLEVHEYRGLYHEIYNEAEPARSRVVSDLLRWLDLQLDRPKRPGHSDLQEGLKPLLQK